MIMYGNELMVVMSQLCVFLNKLFYSLASVKGQFLLLSKLCQEHQTQTWTEWEKSCVQRCEPFNDSFIAEKMSRRRAS